MTLDNKIKVREELAADKSWIVVDGILGEEVSSLYWGKEVEIIYQDMNCQPCHCHAIFEHRPLGMSRFVATDGKAKGNRMRDVIAYRP